MDETEAKRVNFNNINDSRQQFRQLFEILQIISNQMDCMVSITQCYVEMFKWNVKIWFSGLLG